MSTLLGPEGTGVLDASELQAHAGWPQGLAWCVATTRVTLNQLNRSHVVGVGGGVGWDRP